MSSPLLVLRFVPEFQYLTLELENRFFDLYISALRVHLSTESKEVLDELGGFSCQSRGSINIKVQFVHFLVQSVKQIKLLECLYMHSDIIMHTD